MSTIRSQNKLTLEISDPSLEIYSISTYNAPSVSSDLQWLHESIQYFLLDKSKFSHGPKALEQNARGTWLYYLHPKSENIAEKLFEHLDVFSSANIANFD